MIALPDVNVLVALAWPNHLHHSAALRWFQARGSEPWATCPVTESGFVRVSSNHRVIPGARSPAEAIAVLRAMTSLPHHLFWTDDVSMARSTWIAPDHLTGYRQITDAHLLALAIGLGGQLVTFDRGVVELLPASVPHADPVLLLS